MPYRFPRAKNESAAVRISGKTWNRLAAELEAARNVTAAAPLNASVGPNGVALALAAAGLLRVGKTGGSGIAAATSEASPTSGTVTLYRHNGTGWVATTGTVSAKNVASGTNGAVGANKLVILAHVDGQWVVIWELC